jgi:formate hydrogenlyase subunit 3/multisubunit Na+/H+ antiporter MnhD subunit
MNVGQLIYSIVFLPLVLSCFCCFTKKEKNCFHLLFVFFSFFFLTSALILIKGGNKNLLAEYFLLPNFFHLNKITLILLVSVVLIKFITFLRYRFFIFKEAKVNNSFVYSIYFLQNFSLLFIFLSRDIFNIFCFIEIYFCCNFAIFFKINDKKILSNSFKDLLFSASSSALILLCLIFVFVVFRESDLYKIFEIIYAGKNLSKIFFSLSLIFIFSFLVKFFPFWIYFDFFKSRHPLVKFVITESVLIRSVIGIFFTIKIFELVNLNHIENELRNVIFFIAVFLIILSAIEIFYHKNFKIISIYSCISNFSVILVCILMNNSSAFKASYFYTINFLFINFMLLSANRNIKKSNFLYLYFLKTEYQILVNRLINFFIPIFILLALFIADLNFFNAINDNKIKKSLAIFYFTVMLIPNFVNFKLCLEIFLNKKFDKKNYNFSESLKKYHEIKNEEQSN